MAPAMGIVITQATTMRRATPQRTAETRRAAPTPTMAPVMVWVVETGTPSQVAMNRVAAPPVSAQNPCIGVSRVIRRPMVRTMRQPPISVPSAIAAWQASTTQNGTENSVPRWPSEYSSTAMMPMVFCASLPPWPSEYSEAEPNCRMRKARSTANGVERTEAQETIATSTIANRKPTRGDSTIARIVFVSPLQTAAEKPAFAIPPPTRPPISACELEDGIPSPQVIRFQTMAPTRAAKITRASMIEGSMIPVPMVCATCSPNTLKATKLKNAAQNTAYCGRSTRVETMVAIELAASCSPLRKSNNSATAIKPIRTGRPRVVSTVLNLLDHDRIDLVGDVIEAVGDLFKVLVDLGADDEIHGVGTAVLEEQLLQPDVVQVVHPPFQLGQFLGDRAQHRDVLADRLHQRQRAADQARALDQQAAHFPHRRFEASHLEQHHGLGGLLHLVDRIVHRGDQVLDVAAVERRDEGAAHRDQHLAGNVVGIVFELIDALAIHQRLLSALQHLLERQGALRDRLGVPGEQVEEPFLLGEKSAKPTQHENSTVCETAAPATPS